MSVYCLLLIRNLQGRGPLLPGSSPANGCERKCSAPHRLRTDVRAEQAKRLCIRIRRREGTRNRHIPGFSGSVCRCAGSGIPCRTNDSDIHQSCVRSTCKSSVPLLNPLSPYREAVCPHRKYSRCCTPLRRLCSFPDRCSSAQAERCCTLRVLSRRTSGNRRIQCRYPVYPRLLMLLL